MSAPLHLEPAVRDPRKLRRTALCLVAFMVIGGPLLLMAYQKWFRQRMLDDRPSIVHRIQPGALEVVRQDGTRADLADLRGKVVVIHVVDLAQPDKSRRSLEVIRRQVAGEVHADLAVLTLVLDAGPPEGAVAALSKAAADLAVSGRTWWVATNDSAVVARFVRMNLKPSVVPEIVDGHWVFDASVMLVDRNGHLRRAVVPQQRGGLPYIASFDFDQAAEWDAKGIKTGTDLNNEQQLEVLFAKTIGQLLAEDLNPP